jgi:alpha-tubulin suppressor-like RCC1 family protein
MNLLNELSQCNTELLILNWLKKISDDLEYKGYLSNIKKEYLINIAKKHREDLKNQEQNNIWSKSIALMFGSILKKIKKINILEPYYTKEDDLDWGILQKFGQLHKENYSETKIPIYDNIHNIKIIKICTGGASLIALTVDGDVYTRGANGFGQLGHGNNSHTNTLKKLENIPKFKWISSGYAFTSMVSTNGDLYVCGAGENGRLGQGNTDNINIPTKVDLDFKVKISHCGSIHQIVLSEDNKLYSCGQNIYNGHNVHGDQLTFKQIEKLKYINFQMVSIGPGGYHTLALTKLGRLYSWGHNRVGQLGFGNTTGSLVLDDSDHIYMEPTLVSDVSSLNIVSISAGWGHSAILTDKGKLYMCGRNTVGQLGINPQYCKTNKMGHRYISRFTNIEDLSNLFVKKVICGGEHTMVVTRDNKIHLFGDNTCGQLGTTEKLSELYETDNKRDYYQWQDIVDTSEYEGNIIDMALGSSSTYFLFNFSTE